MRATPATPAATHAPYEAKDRLKRPWLPLEHRRQGLVYPTAGLHRPLEAEFAWLKDNAYQQRAAVVQFERLGAGSVFGSAWRADAPPTLIDHDHDRFTNRRLLGVQTAQARKVRIGERMILTAIHKTAVIDPVVVQPLGLQGDEQADLSVHGGLDKTVYALPQRTLRLWRDQRARGRCRQPGRCPALGNDGENPEPARTAGGRCLG